MHASLDVLRAIRRHPPPQEAQSSASSDALLAEAARGGASAAWRAAGALLAVLARDLRGELLPRFGELVGALRRRGEAAALRGQPEAAAESFRAASFVLKYTAHAVVGDARLPRWLGEWQGCLASRRVLVRALSAGALALLLRQHGDDGLRAQLA